MDNYDIILVILLTILLFMIFFGSILAISIILTLFLLFLLFYSFTYYGRNEERLLVISKKNKSTRKEKIKADFKEDKNKVYIKQKHN